MADITVRNQGEVEDSGKVNWRGDQQVVPSEQSIYKSSAIALDELGKRKVVGDRVFRYAKSANTIAAGLICAEKVMDAKFLKATIGADWVVGAKTVTCYASTAATINQFAEGYLHVAQGTNANEGYLYRVKSHAAVSAATNFSVTLYDAIAQTADTSDKVSLHENLYQEVNIGTNEDNPPVGIAPIAVTSGDYFWLQTWGPGAVQVGSAGVAAIGAPVMVGSAGMLETTAGEAIIGFSLATGSALDSLLCFVQIAP